jgi:glycine oxidase
VNVTVIGGGVIGYAAAYELAARGARVRVLDMRGAGRGATRASAGILAPHIEGRQEAVLRLGLCSLELYPPFLERLVADSGVPVEFRESGTLQAAFNAPQGAGLEALALRLRERGVPHALLDGEAARRVEPALGPAVVSALVIDPHGYVRAADLMSALVAAAARLGVASETTAVTAIEAHGSGVRVRTADAVIDSDQAVVAAGSWTGALTPGLPVQPIRGQLVELRFPGPPVSRVVWTEGCYLVPWNNGSVLVGATSDAVGFNEAVDPDATDRLLAACRQVLPGAAAAKVADVRVGLRPSTPDELPVIGRSSTMQGVVFATGHYRHGVLLAPLTAALVADLVMDRRADPILELVRPARFGM